MDQAVGAGVDDRHPPDPGAAEHERLVAAGRSLASMPGEVDQVAARDARALERDGAVVGAADVAAPAPAGELPTRSKSKMSSPLPPNSTSAARPVQPVVAVAAEQPIACAVAAAQHVVAGRGRDSPSLPALP